MSLEYFQLCITNNNYNYLFLIRNRLYFQGLGEFVTFFQKLQTVCEETADAK